MVRMGREQEERNCVGSLKLFGFFCMTQMFEKQQLYKVGT